MTRGAAPGQNYDVVVIGGGINGLVCGTLLAQAKKRVLLIEAREALGGFCQMSDVAPGCRISTFAHLAGPLDTDVVKALKLSKLGLLFSAKQIGAVALSADGRHIAFGEDLRLTTQSLQTHSSVDAKNWPTFETRLRKAAQQWHGWMTRLPGSDGATGQKSGFFSGRSNGRQTAGPDAEFSARLEGSIAELLEEHFRSPLLKGALAFDALIGNALSPWMSGTALLAVLKRALDAQGTGSLVHPQGGLGGLISVVLKAAEASGLKIRTNAKARQFLFDQGRIAGVELVNGETVYAPFVVSSLGAKFTYLKMGAERDLPVSLKKQMHSFRDEPSVAKVNLALNGLPVFKGLDKRLYKDRLLICGTLDSLETSYSAFSQGKFSGECPMEITIPSVHDPSLARAGMHVVSIHMAYVPRQLSGGSWETARQELVAMAGARLREFAPELPDQVVAADVFTPSDLAEVAGSASAHWHGGDLSLDQLGVLRPAYLHSSGMTAVPGLFLCGGGTHPCGGITGINGRLAAEAVLAQSAVAG